MSLLIRNSKGCERQKLRLRIPFVYLPVSCAYTCLHRCYRRLCCRHKWVISTNAARPHSFASRQPIRVSNSRAVFQVRHSTSHGRATVLRSGQNAWAHGPNGPTPAIVLILQDTSANGRQNTFPIHSTAFPSLIFFTAYPSLASLSQSHCNMDFTQNDLPGALSVIIEKSSDFHFHRGRFGRLL